MNMLMMGFSLGPRTCIGKQLSMIESKIATIKFMQRYANVSEKFERQFIFKFAYTLKESLVTFEKKPSEE